MAGAGPGDHGHNNTGQHGAVVKPDLHAPANGQDNRATVIYMPDNAHGTTTTGDHGPTRVYDDIPNETQG